MSASIGPLRQHFVFEGHRLSYGARLLSLALAVPARELFLPLSGQYLHIVAITAPIVEMNFACTA